MNDKLLRELEAAKSEPLEFTSRDRALVQLEEYDLEAQLLAIKELVKRNRESDKALGAEIKALEAEIRRHTGEYVDHLEGSWIDQLHGSVFQDAAHSMAAVGMLAPFVESLFVAIFKGLGANRRPVDGVSDARLAALHDDFWNPRYVFEGGRRRKDVVRGIKRLSESTGLGAYLPDDLYKTLSALFGYRNKMFHNGFEWPTAVRQRFRNAIRENQWPAEWFTQSTSGGKPWIFYMTPDFIQHCFATVDQVLEGVGNYLSEQNDAKEDGTPRILEA